MANLNSKLTLVLGGGAFGHMVVRILKNQKREAFSIVGVLDDNVTLIGQEVHGVAVLGPISDLEELLSKDSGIGNVILAIPLLSRRLTDEIQETCSQFDVKCRAVQSFEDITLLGAYIQDDILPVEALFDKGSQIENQEEIQEILTDQDVLVTGAGGSIGSELCRQILRFGARSLTLLDCSEYNLFQIRRELAETETKLSFVLANICDHERLRSILEKQRPSIVYHAAAFKHVSLLENNAYEAVRNNVSGTLNVLEASVSAGVERFVLISTDKAVEPISVMGATKRIAENLTRIFSGKILPNGNGALKTTAVRFGNVISSSGSVIPLFREQILKGGPVTVTHPEMERLFMSITEAVNLTLSASALESNGDIFIFDMGEPVVILDIAKRMIDLCGRPDIEIKFIGTQPGERLTEDVTDIGELLEPTKLNKVSRLIKSQELSTVSTETVVKKFVEEVLNLDDDGISSELQKFVDNLRKIE